jgi:hypothetical protein
MTVLLFFGKFIFGLSDDYKIMDA